MIVGINKYYDETIPTLEGSENDAKDIYERLTNPDLGDLAFDVPEGHCLIGKDANCSQIRKAISDIYWESEHLDIALFYFSGHGFDDGYGNGYIAPYDMLKNKPFANGINMQELRHVFSNRVNKANIIILDSCYSGIATKGGDILISDEFFEELGEGRFILASSEGDQTSKEVKFRHGDEQDAHTHGAFSFYLIEGLDGKASDKDDKIFLDKLYNYAEEQLRAIGKQRSKVYMADASGFCALQIAVSKQYSEKIQVKIREAEENYLTDQPLDLMDAANIIFEILKMNVKNKKALELKTKISEKLSDYRQSVIGWSLEELPKEEYKPIRKFFQELPKLTTDLDFDKIIKIDNREKGFLAHLCSVSKGVLDKNMFILICKQYYSSPIIPKPTIVGH